MQVYVVIGLISFVCSFCIFENCLRDVTGSDIIKGNGYIYPQGMVVLPH